MKNRTVTARKWECFLSTNLPKQVDPQVDEMWKSAYPGKRVPFGDLRNQWRRQHCRTLNPYGSESCPYPMVDCALVFLMAVSATTHRHPESPVGYFRAVAKSFAAQRADEKPLRRGLTPSNTSGRIIRTGVPDEEPKAQGPGDPGSTTEGTESRQTDSRGVRGSIPGPASIGDVLGSLDLRPHQGSTPHGEEGTE